MAEEAFTDGADLELLPADQAEVVSADEQLDAAEASALDAPLTAQVTSDPVIPFGRTAPFDYTTGRFIRLGDGAIPWISGPSALREWAQAALHTGRGGSPIFSDDFGFENMDDWLGEADPSVAMATLEDRLRECLTRHERVEDIDDYEADYDATKGVLELRKFTIVTDQAEAILLGDFDTAGGV